MKVLVCGGRAFAQQQLLMSTLDTFHKLTPITCIIEGEAPGADTMARTWAQLRGVAFLPFPADWYPNGRENGIDRSAGTRRNTQMLVEGKPDLIIAFPGRSGTANMVMQGRRAKVPVVTINT